jgi:membrane-associated phospholipid phosphatase
MMLTDTIYSIFRNTPKVLSYFSLASDFLVYGAVVIFYIFWFYTSLKQKKFNKIFFIELTLGLFIAFSLVGWLKIVFPEIRPYSYYFADKPQYFDSFPSRHTAIVSALAFLVLPSYLGLGAGFIVISVLVGILRWISLFHWPMDIIVGWFLGMLIAIFVNEVSKLLFKLKKNNNKHI